MEMHGTIQFILAIINERKWNFSSVDVKIRLLSSLYLGYYRAETLTYVNAAEIVMVDSLSRKYACSKHLSTVK